VANEKRMVTLVLLAFVAGLLLAMMDIQTTFAEQAKSKVKATTIRMGTVTKIDSQFVVKSGRTTYGIAGRDFSPWVGKKVKVTGTMSRTEKGRVLEVTKIEEVKRNK